MVSIARSCIALCVVVCRLSLFVALVFLFGVCVLLVVRSLFLVCCLLCVLFIVWSFVVVVCLCLEFL